MERVRAPPLPSKKAHAVCTGKRSTWGSSDSRSYCLGLGIALPAWVEPRHQALTIQLADGTTAYVPARALMRAFFWPGRDVLPATFTHPNVDQFAYVDFRPRADIVVSLAAERAILLRARGNP